jgi:hypothetical protein
MAETVRPKGKKKKKKPLKKGDSIFSKAGTNNNLDDTMGGMNAPENASPERTTNGIS